MDEELAVQPASPEVRANAIQAVQQIMDWHGGTWLPRGGEVERIVHEVEQGMPVDRIVKQYRLEHGDRVS